MGDRTCVCGKWFTYPSLLIRHLNHMSGCKILYNATQTTSNTTSNTTSSTTNTNKNNSKLFIKKKTDNKNNNVYECDDCKRIYSNKQNLNRHCKTCKTKQEFLINNTPNTLENTISSTNETNDENDVFLDKLSEYIKFIKVYRKQKDKVAYIQQINNYVNSLPDSNIKNSENPIPMLLPTMEPEPHTKSSNTKLKNPILANQTPTSNIHVETTNNTNTHIEKEQINNGTINNQNNHHNVNITINNNITTDKNIPFVYPFGYENINFITNDDIIEIIKSSEPICLLLKKIWSHQDNNNFMKLNNKENTVSYIKSTESVDLCDDKEFIAMMCDNSKVLLDRLFYKLYENLKFEDQLLVWNYSNDHIKSMLYDPNNKRITKNCQNLISNKSHNYEDKKRYNEVKNGIQSKNPDIIIKTNDAQNETNKTIKIMYKEMQKSNIDMQELDATLWNHPMNLYKYDISNANNDPRREFIQNTPRYKKRQELEKQELEYLAKEDVNIGDIVHITNHQKNRAKKEIEDIKINYPDLNENVINDLEKTLLDIPNKTIKNKIQGLRYPLTDQDFKKSLGLDYADSVQNLRFHTVLHPSTPRCFDTFSRLRDKKKQAKLQAPACSNYLLT